MNEKDNDNIQSDQLNFSGQKKGTLTSSIDCKSCEAPITTQSTEPV